MYKSLALFAALCLSSTALAQVDDSLVWIGGDDWDGTHGNAVVAAFDTSGSQIYQYDFARTASGSVASDPAPLGVVLLGSGHHAVAEAGVRLIYPYTPWTPPAGADPTVASGLWFGTSWNPGAFSDQAINFYSGSTDLDKNTVDIEVDSDGEVWSLLENGVAQNRPISQYAQAYFQPGIGETVRGLEVSATHVYGFVEDNATKNVTVYRQRRTPTGSPLEEQMTTVASGKPYQAITIVGEGAIVLAEVEHNGSLVRAGTIARTGPSGPQWSVPLDKPVIDLKSQGGWIWALDSLGNLYKLDPATGLSTPPPTASGPTPFVATGVSIPLGFARGFHDGSEAYTVADNCPNDPLKYEPAACGCDYEEIPSYNVITETYGHYCRHLTAELDTRHQIGAGSRIGARSTLGQSAGIGSDTFIGDNVVIDEWAVVGNNTIVANNTTLGNRAQIHSGTIIGRGTMVGPCAEIYNGTIIGRNASIAGQALIFADVSIGYGVEVPSGSQIGSNAVVGNLVEFAENDPAFIGVNGSENNPAVIARGAELGADSRVYAGAVIGPNVVVGDDAVVEEGARLRKDVTLGTGAYIEDGARIGRSSQFGASAGVGTDANLGTAVIVSSGACVPNDERVRSRTTVSSPACDGPFNTDHVPNWDATYRPNTTCFPDLPCVACDSGDSGFMAPPF